MIFDLPSEGNGERNTTKWSELSLTAVACDGHARHIFHDEIGLLSLEVGGEYARDAPIPQFL